MKQWTSEPQRHWLENRIPEFRRALRLKRVKAFLDDTSHKFLIEFPAAKPDKEPSTPRIKKWFYNHGNVPKSERKVPRAAPSLELRKPTRKPTPLTRAQAFSVLHAAEGSALHAELTKEHQLFISSDPTTVEKYQHLFPPEKRRTLLYVTFQQAVLKERFPTMPEEEKKAIDDFIDQRLKREIDLRENPWLALKVDETQSDADLERQYVKEQIDNTPRLFDDVCGEVKDITNFNTFVLCGGPNPIGMGGIQLFHITTGETVLTGETFDQFLGPMWDTLKAKYWEWLARCYSHEETYRAEGSISGSSRTPGPEASRSTSKIPAPETALMDVLASATVAPDLDVVMTSQTGPSSVINDVSDDQTNDTSDYQFLLPSHHSSPSPRHSSPPPPRHSSPPPPRHSSPPLPHALSPSWTPGPQHRLYLRDAVPYLIEVSAGPEWGKLVERYVTFEGLSFAKSGSSKMPVRPRPEELGWWFQIGRRYFTPKNLPKIKSVAKFEEKWLQWWSAGQPKWRVAQGWPFAKGDAAGKDWGHLLEGGKDGMFLVVVSLAWWIKAQDSLEESEEGSELDVAIADVAWVLRNLNAQLAIEATSSAPPPATTTDSSPATTTDSSPFASSSASTGQRPKPTRTYGGKKQSRE